MRFTVMLLPQRTVWWPALKHTPGRLDYRGCKVTGHNLGWKGDHQNVIDAGLNDNHIIWIHLVVGQESAQQHGDQPESLMHGKGIAWKNICH